MNKNVLRQELAVVSIRVAWLSTKSSCNNIFKDISSTNPNNWACVNIESLVDNNWQQEIVNYATEKWVIDKFNDYNTLAARGWIFDIADSLIKIEEKEKWIKRERYSDDS